MRHTLTLILTALLALGAGTLRADGDAIPAGEKLGVEARAREAPHIIEKIIEHAQDLNLTAGQKSKLQKIENELKADRDKLKGDAEVRELFKKMREARKNNDQAAAEAARKQLRGEVEKQLGKSPKDLMEEVKQILTPEQRQKIHELIGKNGGAGGARGGEKMKEFREKMQERRNGNGGGANDAQKPRPGPAPVPFDDKAAVSF